jgi:glycosyltransferase involved in cell wall biosynthesis
VLIPRKGVHHLIAAFARIARELPAARLSIVGAEENRAYALQLKEAVARNALLGRVEFAAPMPQARLAERMRGARALVLPSASEGLPRVVLEAMAVGLPIVATRASGIPDVLTDGINGLLFAPGDEETLARHLRSILTEPAWARELGRAARDFAERGFSTERYLSGYRELLAAASRVGGSGEPLGASLTV